MTVRAYPALPEASRDADAQFRLLQALRESVEIHERRRGRVEDSFVTVQDLILAGLVDPNALNFFKNTPTTKPTGVIGPDVGSGSGTIPDPSAIIDAVTTNVLNSALFSDLNTAINLRIRSFYQSNPPTATAIGDLWFDTDDSFKQYRWNGSSWAPVTDSRIATLVSDVATNTANIATEIINRQNADTSLSAQITTLSADLSGVESQLATEISTRASADATQASQITTLQSNYTSLSSSLTTEITTRSTADSAFAQQLSLLGAANGTNTAWNLNMATVYVNPTTTIATRFSSLDIRVDNVEGNLTSEQLARQQGDQAVISSVDTLSLTVGGHTGQIQTLNQVVSGSGGLTAQFMLKTNVNGHIAGFGLYNTGATSDFIVQADRFAIVRSTGGTTTVPFVVGNINGSTGVGIDGSLVVDGTILGRSVAALTITADKIDSRNLTIKDASGNILFGAGTALDWTRITANPSWLNGNISISPNGQLNGAGGGQVSLSGLGAGAMAFLNSINAGNVTTYIDSGVILNAYIVNLTADKLASNLVMANLITLSGTGHIKAGQTAFNTGSGFFLGFDAGTPKFSIGNPAGAYMYWDGSQLVVRGQLIPSTSYTVSNSGNLIGVGSRSNGTVAYGFSTVTVSGGTAPYVYTCAVVSINSGNDSPVQCWITSGDAVSTSSTSLNVAVSGNATNNRVFAGIAVTVTDSTGRVGTTSFRVNQLHGTQF